MNPSLDLVFVCDCTGSMGSYLAAVRENILDIAQAIYAQTGASIRFSLVQYRDHPPEDCSFVVRACPFVTTVQEISVYLNMLSACGGGDGPEALADGLFAALNLEWRPEAAKVAIVITDAPPHGLEASMDGFPNGCPCGNDPLRIAREMARCGIVCYTVGAEPTLSEVYNLARDFLRALAAITGGRFVSLSSADSLASVIVGSAVEEIELCDLMSRVSLEAKKLPVQSKFDVIQNVTHSLQRQNVLTTKLDVRDAYMGQLPPLPDAWHSVPNITSVRSAIPPSGPRVVPIVPGSVDSVRKDAVDIDQVARAFERLMKIGEC